MYGKIFDSIFSSTLVADGGWLPTYIFMSMVAMADKDGYVTEAPKALFRRLGFREYDTKITYDDFTKALEYLCDEDPTSNSPSYHGRRLIPVIEIPSYEGNRGWWVVNYAHYREKGSSTDRVRRYRESNKNKDLKNDVTPKPLQSVTETHTDTDTDKQPIGQKGFDQWWDLYPKKVKKKTALAIWKRKRLEGMASVLIADIPNRLKNDRRWKEGYIPDPTTYLNQERWDDEIEAAAKGGNGKAPQPSDDISIAREGKRLKILPKPGESQMMYNRRVLEAMRDQPN